MLLEFVTSEKREYQTNILTELRAVKEVHWLEMNVVFFYKSNWQNELLRLQRRNKFICALTVSIQECGIEGPRMRYPGQKESFPVYLQNMQNNPTPGVGRNGTPDNPAGNYTDQPHDAPFVPSASDDPNEPRNGGSVPGRRGSILRQPGQPRETLAAMGKRVDFSLGMSSLGVDDPSGDVLDDRDTAARQRATVVRVTSPSRSRSNDRDRSSHETGRSTSIQRVGTNGSMRARERNHMNRFFSRSRHGDEEIGMANIPEGEYDSSPPNTEKIDPRSGLVSPRAVRTSHDEVRSQPPQSSGALSGSDRTFAPPLRSQTDNIEMRRFH
jgi:hypothetical protein